MPRHAVLEAGGPTVGLRVCGCPPLVHLVREGIVPILQCDSIDHDYVCGGDDNMVAAGGGGGGVFFCVLAYLWLCQRWPLF